MATPRNDHELFRLVSRYCDDQATPEEIRWLDEQIVSSSLVRRMFLECMTTEADLGRLSAPDQVHVESSEPVAEPDRSVPAAVPWGTLVARAIDWRRHPLPFISTVSMLTFMFVSVLLIWIWAQRGSEKISSSIQAQAGGNRLPIFVAKVTGSHQATESPGSAPVFVGAHLRQGQTIRLKDGLAEVRFHNGAQVVLEGPVEFQVQTDQQGRLSIGRLVARCETDTAKGFVIETPNARVEDLGTEFGVAVRPGGSTVVAVLQGLVRVGGNEPGGQLADVTVSEGQAVAVRSDHGQVDRLANDVEGQFVRSLPIDAILNRQNLVLNPNFEFVGSSEFTNAAKGRLTLNDADVPHWTQDGGAKPIVSNPTSIFKFSHTYFQIQTPSTAALYQHVKIPTATQAVLSMVASHRSYLAVPDNSTGHVFLELYAGAITSFAGEPMTPTSVKAPALSSSLQTFSNQYQQLPPGDYTIRVGGTCDGGKYFQAGISQVQLMVPANDASDEASTDHHDNLPSPDS